jgi:hypothetical protein
MEAIDDEKRKRAWILINVIEGYNVVEVANAVKALKGDDNFVMIRVDQVDSEVADMVADMVAVIDTAGGDYYEEAIRKIVQTPGLEIKHKLVVTNHNPFPPHNASGFITPAEQKLSQKFEVYVKAGRQDNSPGYNPWG